MAVELPTVPSPTESLEANIASITKKIDQLPFKGIGNNLQKTMADSQQVMENLNGVLLDLNAVLLELKQYPAGFFLGEPPLPAKGVQTPSK